MYLNSITSNVCFSFPRLTVTLDVFKLGAGGGA